MAGPRPSLTWSPEALVDLSEIWSYYADAAGPQVADSVIRNIEKAVLLLEDHPFSGRTRDEIRSGLRSIAARPYVVFYRVSVGGAEIIRVLHGRRDIGRIFSVR